MKKAIAQFILSFIVSISFGQSDETVIFCGKFYDSENATFKENIYIIVKNNIIESVTDNY